MIDNIKNFSASVGGYMGNSFSVAIDFKKASAKYAFYEHGYKLKNSETVLLSESKIEDLIKTLDKIKIIEWKARYPNPGIFDGTNWGLEIIFGDNKKFSSSGDNAFPGKWKAFCNAIEDLLGKDFE
jgi:hypothetical protein